MLTPTNEYDENLRALAVLAGGTLLFTLIMLGAHLSVKKYENYKEEEAEQELARRN